MGRLHWPHSVRYPILLAEANRILNVTVPPLKTARHERHLMTDAPTRKLPIDGTVSESLRLVWQHRRKLLHICATWFAIMLPIYVLAHWVLWQMPTGGILRELLRWLLVPFIEAPFLASIAVAWHRLLLSKEDPPPGSYLRLDPLVIRFAAVSFALFFAPALPLAILFSDAVIGSVSDRWTSVDIIRGGLLLLAIAYLFFALPRLSLILPAMAIEQPITLAEAWRLTRRHTWRLTIGTLLTLLPGLAAMSLCERAFGDDTQVEFILKGALSAILYAVLATCAVSFLSLCHRHFRAAVPPGGPAAGA